MKELLNSWQELTDLVDSTHDDSPADFEYLEEIGAHSILTKLAQIKSGILGHFSLYWAPDSKQRQFVPDHLFKNSLVFGDDGCGNFLCWMNVKKANSPILFLCHDPPVVTLISETPTDFMKKFLSAAKEVQNKKSKTLEAAWERFFETPELEENAYKASDDGLVIDRSDDKAVIDFRKAKPGAEIGMDFLGKNTVLDDGIHIGKLRMYIDISKKPLKTQLRDWIFFFSLIILPIGIAYWFHEKSNQSWVGSLAAAYGITWGLTFFSYFKYHDVRDRIIERREKRENTPK